MTKTIISHHNKFFVLRRSFVSMVFFSFSYLYTIVEHSVKNLIGFSTAPEPMSIIRGGLHIFINCNDFFRVVYF